MIQLIGFLVSIYMFVRGLDILSQVDDRKAGSSTTLAGIAGWIAIAGGVIFFILFIVQGNSMPNSPSF
jgi:hypothetical protein